MAGREEHVRNKVVVFFLSVILYKWEERFN